MPANDAKNDLNFTQNHTCIWVRHSGLSIYIIVINQWLSYYKYIYIYVSDQSGQIKDRDILSVVDAGKVRGQTGTNQALHTLWQGPSMKIHWPQIITHHMFNTQLYKFFTCFWGISTYKNCYKFVQHWILRGNETPL